MSDLSLLPLGGLCGIDSGGSEGRGQGSGGRDGLGKRRRGHGNGNGSGRCGSSSGCSKLRGGLLTMDGWWRRVRLQVRSVLTGFVFRGTSAIEGISGSSSGGDSSRSGIGGGGERRCGLGRYETRTGRIVGDGDGGMANADGVLDVLGGGASAKNVTSEVGGVFGSIFGDKGTELTFIAEEGALFVNDTTEVGEDWGTRTTSAF